MDARAPGEEEIANGARRSDLDELTRLALAAD
jgi:hypothetical protein